MKLAKEIISLIESDEKPKRPVNYKLKVMIMFNDGALNPRGSAMVVKALDADDAKKVARERIEKNWERVKSIEFISVKKGS